MKNKDVIWFAVMSVIASLISVANFEYAAPIIILGVIAGGAILGLWINRRNNKIKDTYGHEEIVRIQDYVINEENRNIFSKAITDEETSSIEDLITKYTFAITIDTKLEDLVFKINALLKKLKHNTFIDTEDIYKMDNEFIKKRREDNYPTLRHDFNMVINVLNNSNLDVIEIKTPVGKSAFGIVPFEKIDDIGDYKFE